MVTPEILTALPFFAGLSETELKSMSIIANKVSFQRGDLIFREDDPAHTLYLLLDGWVDVVVNTDAKGEQHELVTTLSPGDIFGWSALVDPYVYTGSAVCASPVEAIEFKGADLLGMFELDPKLCCVIMRRVCQVIADRLRATRLQMVSLFVAH
ncbi:MAG: cyclic nucleotide-binding domain-containing protein [Anaerolineae bacterium]|nr:cyclic nucleotide-binding domain-containing protein [Anaerolineae bacterium]NIQ77026.1 cyclic nucleotide-binding domain-containing protein [Anaerolineae bacterium]